MAIQFEVGGMKKLTELEQKLLNALCVITYYDSSANCYLNSFTEYANLNKYLGEEIVTLMKENINE